VHNLDGKPREVTLDPGLGDDGALLVNLLSDDHSRADRKTGRQRLLLEPYGYRWYRIGGLDYLLKRSDIDR
jgi:maltose alpha-D-glucosyltransferase/alpha-amylase